MDARNRADHLHVPFDLEVLRRGDAIDRGESRSAWVVGGLGQRRLQLAVATPQVPLLGPEIVQLVLEPLAKLSWKTMPAWAFATRPVQQTSVAVSLIVMERTCSGFKKAPRNTKLVAARGGVQGVNPIVRAEVKQSTDRGQ
jgi:hypothetical protein